MTKMTIFSSAIAGVGWEMDTLEVEFTNGYIYRYYNIPYNYYLSIMNSFSLESTLSQLDKSHRYSRI